MIRFCKVQTKVRISGAAEIDGSSQATRKTLDPGYPPIFGTFGGGWCAACCRRTVNYPAMNPTKARLASPKSYGRPGESPLMLGRGLRCPPVGAAPGRQMEPRDGISC